MRAIVILLLAAGPSAGGAASPRQAPPSMAAQGVMTVAMDTRQAEAVLAILRKESAGRPVESADWERLFATDGYRRLEAREASMKRPFSRDEFRKFVRSEDLVSRSDALARTLAAWKAVDVGTAGQRALAYLPEGARIEATIFPVIKPRPNSFVFQEPTPGIFLALDPAVTPAQLANTLAHELHHIGFSSSCPGKAVSEEDKRLPASQRSVRKWLSPFGEGFAMLAAAGGPDVHPHAVSRAEDRDRWDRDFARVDEDLRTLDRFFRDILEGKLGDPKADERGFFFFGVQGPWYTVGYRMAVTIERGLGPEAVIQAFCDPRRLPDIDNRAATRLGAAGPRPRWSPELVRALAF